MKTSSVSVKKRINRGNITSDDPEFEKQVLKMDIQESNVKKKVMNKPTSNNNNRLSAQGTKSPNTSQYLGVPDSKNYRSSSSNSNYGTATIYDENSAAKQAFEKLIERNNNSFLSENSPKPMREVPMQHLYDDNVRDVQNEIQKQRLEIIPSVTFLDETIADNYIYENENTNKPVLTQVIECNEYYQKTVMFVETRQRSFHNNDSPTMKKSLLEKHHQEFMVKKRNLLHTQADEVADGLRVQQEESYLDCNELLKQVEQIVKDNIAPLKQIEIEKNYTIKGFKSRENEKNVLRDKINIVQNANIIQNLANDDEVDYRPSQQLEELENEVQDLSNKILKKQVVMDRNDKQFSQSQTKDSLQEYQECQRVKELELNEQTQNLKNSEFQITAFNIEIQRLNSVQQKLEAETLGQQIRQYEQTQLMALMKEEIFQYQSIYDKQILLQKSEIRDKLKQVELLQQKVQNLERDKLLQAKELSNKASQNDTQQLERISERSNGQDVSDILSEIEDILQLKFDSLYPKVESEQGESYESREYEDKKELDRIAMLHENIKEKECYIENVDQDNEKISQSIDQTQNEIFRCNIINDLNVVIQTEKNQCEKCLRGIYDDYEKLNQINEDQLGLLETEIFAQSSELIKDLSLNNQISKNDILIKQKLEQIMLAEAKLNVKKNDQKQLEQLQRKKDEIIAELESLAGKDKKVIKEVFVDKVRDNKVDDVVQNIITQGCRVPIHKISENYYQFGSRKIYVKYDAQLRDVMVRDKGGRYLEVNQYIRDNEDTEALKMGLQYQSQNNESMNSNGKYDRNFKGDNSEGIEKPVHTAKIKLEVQYRSNKLH
ncbi:UNKNOWN [Stylonychia lemnae]|uniref:Uncharacterized protein n=1 Tax=Stylonychia lemnae TaxID=5949 RepID=A0A078AQJ2_STYLE|nr:UNKNOWN [Stylonychia lemnae]|eukprot:CDW83188.1 UNKNOWN [Stylonychia lemnae]